jgi:hypothetical protein
MIGQYGVYKDMELEQQIPKPGCSWIDPVSRKITIDDDLLQIAVNPD